MTKTQLKARLAKIIEMLNEAQSLMDDLATEAEETRDSIEPYENHYDLTDQQQERYDFFDNAVDTLGDEASNLTDMIYNLKYLQD